MKPNQKLNIIGIGTRVSVKFHYTLFPFNVYTFANLLSSHNYTIAKSLPLQSPLTPPGQNVTGSGGIAYKNDFAVDINMDKQFFGLSGNVPQDLLKEFQNIINNMIELELFKEEKITFYELQGKFVILPNDNPIKLFATLGKKMDILKDMKQVFKSEMNLFSARFSEGLKGPNNPDYFELYFQPSLGRGEKELGLNVVYRNQDSDKFNKFVSHLDKNIEKIIKKYFK